MALSSAVLEEASPLSQQQGPQDVCVWGRSLLGQETTPALWHVSEKGGALLKVREWWVWV
jgi:hypothetical protein